MAEQIGDIGIKYCPNCRNLMEYHGDGRYGCLLCCTHVVVLNKNPNLCYEVPFTNEEKEAYYLARIEGIRNQVFFEREREREVKKKEKSNPMLTMKTGTNTNFHNMEDKIEDKIEDKTEETSKHIEQKLSPTKECTICGRSISSGTYCKECTFLQIKRMQRKDLEACRDNIVTDNYGSMRYKGYQDE